MRSPCAEIVRLVASLNYHRWAHAGEVLLEQKARFANTSAISTYLRTWATGGDPCVDGWTGVTCSDGSVTELCGLTAGLGCG